MANENATENANPKPWYKRPSVWGVIVAFAGVVVAVITILLQDHPPDFTIAVVPMQGTVQQGGLTQTAVSVSGSNGYRRSVSLSATGQPSDIAIGFVPQAGQATPPYTSTASIRVPGSVPTGDYSVAIKGVGEDGKEQMCNYTLSVIPGPVAQTADSTPPPTEPYTVYSDNGIAGGDIWVWSGADFGHAPPKVDGNFVIANAPEGKKCFAATSGSGAANYVGWGVFLGTFANHELVQAQPEDLSGYGSLQFWAKTPVNLKVELQQDDKNGRKSRPCMISSYGWKSSSPNAWQQITIPRSSFGSLNMTKVFCPFMITGTGGDISFYVDDVKWVP